MFIELNNDPAEDVTLPMSGKKKINNIDLFQKFGIFWLRSFFSSG